MKTPENDKINLSDQKEIKDIKDIKGTEKDDKILTDDELDSVAGGVAPIIKPPSP